MSWPQGTGQALQTAARDDADLLLAHDPEAGQKFITTGDGIDSRQIAWNDFIVVGLDLTRRISPVAKMRLRR
jgi:tungstate transport system substrate-binding protein